MRFLNDDEDRDEIWPETLDVAGPSGLTAPVSADEKVDIDELSLLSLAERSNITANLLSWST